MIGILRLLIELGCIDIAYKVSLLYRYLVSPHTGNFLQALHVFKYLYLHRNNEISLDPKYQ